MTGSDDELTTVADLVSAMGVVHLQLLTLNQLIA
jgi:hypothetical protein